MNRMKSFFLNMLPYFVAKRKFQAEHSALLTNYRKEMATCATCHHNLRWARCNSFMMHMIDDHKMDPGVVYDVIADVYRRLNIQRGAKRA